MGQTWGNPKMGCRGKWKPGLNLRSSGDLNDHPWGAVNRSESQMKHSSTLRLHLHRAKLALKCGCATVWHKATEGESAASKGCYKVAWVLGKQPGGMQC